MKNLTKIFVAVAALFAGFACTTDVTEDLGVVIDGQATLTLSLEESRTQLGGDKRKTPVPYRHNNPYLWTHTILKFLLR